MSSLSLPAAIIALSRALGGRTEVSQRCSIPDHLLVDWAFGIGAPDTEQWTTLQILASRVGVEFPPVPSGSSAPEAPEAAGARAKGSSSREPQQLQDRAAPASSRLSVEEEQPLRGPSDSRRPRRALPVTVLVVDDDVHFRSALRELLERHGFEVEEAENGIDALDKLMSAALAPDLLLIDLKMPRMDGTALLSALKSREGLAAIPAIVVSGYAAPSCMPGVQRVYQKDETLMRLVDDVRALVGHQAFAPTRH